MPESGLQEEIGNDLKSERLDQLRVMLGSAAWKHVARPSLERRRAEIARSIAAGSAMEIERVRFLQGQYSLLTALIEDTEKMLREED